MCKQNVVALAYDKRGKLLAVGRNSYQKTHPIQKKYCHEVGLDHRDMIYLHAEIDVLIKTNFNAHKVVINRISASGDLLPSQPCGVCMKALIDAGVEELNFIAPTIHNETYWDRYQHILVDLDIPNTWQVKIPEVGE